MEKVNVKNLVISAILAAMVIVSIFFIHIPMIGQGYVHIGDSFILIGALLGPMYGFLVGGIGAMLGDVLTGYAVYAPWSLIIHGLQGVLMALVITKITNLNVIKFFIFGLLISTLTVVFGYAIVEYLLSGQQMALALATIPINFLQVTVGSVIGAALYAPVKKLLSLRITTE